jgi:hypothetical protein
MRSKVARLAFLVAFSSMFSGVVFGQSTGTIHGTANDVTGAVMPNATVTITSQATYAGRAYFPEHGHLFTARACIAVETHENWIEAMQYLNMEPCASRKRNCYAS